VATGQSLFEAIERNRSRVGRQRIWVLTGFALIAVAASLVQFNGLTDRPPGFYIDESAFGYNAWTIATAGVDEHGAAWPILFESFGDWKSGPYVYVLAAVFKVVGPSILAARAVGAIAGLVTAALLAVLAWQLTRRASISAVVAITAILTPWLFEPTRLTFEVTLMPGLIAGFLLLLRSRRADVRWSWAAVIALAILLGAITYTYALGRLLGPLFAAGLVLYVRRPTWTNVPRVWLAFAVALLPLLATGLEHPGSLTARLDNTGYLGGPLSDVIARFFNQLLGNLDLARWLLVGDSNERHHVAGVMGSLLAATFALAVLGLDRVVHQRSKRPFWWFVIYASAAALVPASLTTDDFHVHRLIAVPVLLIVLTIPAMAWLLQGGQGRRARVAVLAVLVAATAVQGAWFQIRYADVAPGRGAWFDDAYPHLLDEALATGASPIYLIDGLVPGYIHAYWYGTLRGVDPARFVHLPRDSHAPSGAVVLSSEAECGPCDELDSGGFFRLYRVP
jgi:hypothetical protein